MRKLLKKCAVVPELLVPDDLRSYGAAARDLHIEHLHERGRWLPTGPAHKISDTPVRLGASLAQICRDHRPEMIHPARGAKISDAARNQGDRLLAVPAAAENRCSSGSRSTPLQRPGPDLLCPRGCHVNLAPAEREVEGLALVQAAVAAANSETLRL
jgi:hypothetical protein